MPNNKISPTIAAEEPALKVVAIVEDFEPFRGILVRMVARMGYTSQSFPTAEEFLCAVRHQEAPDQEQNRWSWGCLLTDINLMEGSRRKGILRAMDGLSLVSHLRSLSRFTTLPMIVMSGDPSVEREAIAAGVDDFLLKPVEGVKLQAALNRAMEIKKDKK